MKTREGEQEIGGGITGVGRFFTDPCHCGSNASYGTCCGAAEATLFLIYCDRLSLEREIALEFGQLAWRIARDTPSARWSTRITEVAMEICEAHPENLEKLLRIVSALLEAHRLVFPGVDGSVAHSN